MALSSTVAPRVGHVPLVFESGTVTSKAVPTFWIRPATVAPSSVVYPLRQRDLPFVRIDFSVPIPEFPMIHDGGWGRSERSRHDPDCVRAALKLRETVHGDRSPAAGCFVEIMRAVVIVLARVAEPGHVGTYRVQDLSRRRVVVINQQNCYRAKILLLAKKDPGREFQPEDEDTLVMLASQAALVIENARRHREERRARADRRRILKVLNNLISNAARYSEASSVIQVTAVREDAYVNVSMTEPGGGDESGSPERPLQEVLTSRPGPAIRV